MFKKKHLFIIPLLVSLITILVYIPALQNDFVNLDDDEYVYENPNIQSLNLKSMRWMFTAFHSANWHPVTWLSHALDYGIWGLNPTGHHLTSVFIHGFNTFLVVLLITCLSNLAIDNKRDSSSGEYRHNAFTIPVAAGAVTGLLFGIHPLHVESVAWVSERKDLLYAFFFLLSVLAYLQYTSVEVRRQKILHYVLSVSFFLLSLMSKPMAVTLPAVLTILDYYPLRRFDITSAFSRHRKVLMEKLPFWGLSFVSIVLTVSAQREAGAIKSLQSASLQDRILVSCRSFVFYIQKMLWPKDLVPLYPYPQDVSLLRIEYVASLLFVVIITACCFFLWRRRRLWLTVWAYYVITLLPVSGIIQVGGQAAADRYTYMASLGPFLLVGLSAVKLIEKTFTREPEKVLKRFSVISALTVISIMLIPLVNITIKQQTVWRDSVTLWNSVMKTYPDITYYAYFSLGKYYRSQGRTDKAVEHYGRAIKLNPTFIKAYNNLGNIYHSEGLIDRAVEHYRYAIKIEPYSPNVHYNLATAYQSKGLFDEAVREYKIAIEMKVDFAEAHYNLAVVYNLQGSTHKAEEHFRIARQLKPALFEGRKTK